MNTKASLSISMIVKNEEKHIGRVLENAHLFADEIIVLDTGSTDRTVEIAKQFGATIHYFNWCSDFAKARNASLSYCSMDFVMWLDADDLLPLDDALRLRELLSNDIEWDVLYLPYYYNYHPDKPIKGKRKKAARIFRNHFGISWFSPIHEHLVFPNATRKNKQINTISIYHYPLRESHANALRNLLIMHQAAKDPENLGNSYHFWHIAKEYSGLGNPTLAIEYYNAALAQGRFDYPFMRARQYYGLGKQYHRISEYPSAIAAFGLCAVMHPGWREPFAAIAECYLAMHETDLALAYVTRAESIPMHDLQIERAELYEGNTLQALRKKLTGMQAHALCSNADQHTSLKTHRLFAGGDVYLGRQMPDYITLYGTDAPFKNLGVLTKHADLFLVNLECIVSSTGKLTDKGEKRPYYFRSNPIVLDVLVEAGINVVTTGNNHAMDYGAQALFEQKELLTACQIANPGSGETIEAAAGACFIKVDELIIAIISIDAETSRFKIRPGKMGINSAENYAEVAQSLYGSIAHAKQYANLVIVSPHWGGNWKDAPNSARINLAHTLIDAGADLILGHSSHILQGIEIYRGKFIVYDMGCLLADKVAQSRMRFSALFDFEFNRQGFTKLKIHPVLLKKAQATLATTNDAEFIKKLLCALSQKFPKPATFNAIENYLEVAMPESGSNWTPTLQVAPEYVYRKCNLKKLPAHYLTRPNSALVKPDLDSLSQQKEILLNDRIRYIGCQFPDTVKPGYAFVVRLYFSVLATLAGHWELMITGTHTENSEIQFEYPHPFAEGALPVALWKQGDNLCDECVVRPPKNLAPGSYQLAWKFFNRNSTEELTALDEHGQIITDFVMGTIHITEAAPKAVAGLA